MFGGWMEYGKKLEGYFRLSVNPTDTATCQVKKLT